MAARRLPPVAPRLRLGNRPVSERSGRGHYLHGVTQVRYDAATMRAVGRARARTPLRTPFVALALSVVVLLIAACSNPNLEAVVGVGTAAPGSDSASGNDPTGEDGSASDQPTSDDGTVAVGDAGLPGLATGGDESNDTDDSAAPAPTAVFAPEDEVAPGVLPTGAFLIARSGAGRQVPAGGGQASILAVYDEPDGTARSLAYTRPDNSTLRYPLVNPTFFGNKLVLRVVEGDEDDDFVRVQAPIRPSYRHVWVKTSDFDWMDGEQRIEVDLNETTMRAYTGDERLLSSRVALGAADTPTPLGVSYVSEVIGTTAPIFNLALFSEVSSGPGEALPAVTLLGTADRADLGTQVTRGTLRVPNNVMERLAEELSAGALVVIFDSSSPDTDRGAILAREWLPAETLAP